MRILIFLILIAFPGFGHCLFCDNSLDIRLGLSMYTRILGSELKFGRVAIGGGVGEGIGYGVKYYFKKFKTAHHLYGAVYGGFGDESRYNDLQPRDKFYGILIGDKITIGRKCSLNVGSGIGYERNYYTTTINSGGTLFNRINMKNEWGPSFDVSFGYDLF